MFGTESKRADAFGTHSVNTLELRPCVRSVLRGMEYHEGRRMYVCMYIHQRRKTSSQSSMRAAQNRELMCRHRVSSGWLAGWKRVHTDARALTRSMLLRVFL